MNETIISWATVSWNALRGCSIASPGCKNCYAMRRAATFGRTGAPTNPFKLFAYLEGDEPRWTGKVSTLPAKLREPFALKGSQRVFIASMSDMFHDEVPWAFLDQMFAVMWLCPQHIFQGLTKRERELRRYTNDPATPERIARAALGLRGESESLFGVEPAPWPIPNVHLGCSIENDVWARRRLPELRETQAAVRWISAEPLLSSLGELDLTGIDWVVVGGESGPGYRPMEMAWAREIRDQCVAQGVALFFKQDAAFRTETRCYLVEEDGACYRWHQYPHNFAAPVQVQPDSLAYHLKAFPQAKALYGAGVDRRNP